MHGPPFWTLDHGPCCLDPGSWCPGSWCPGSWIIVPWTLDHGAALPPWCPGSWTILPGSWCLDHPGPGTTSTWSPGSWIYLAPGAWIMVQYPEFCLHWILVPRIRDQSMYAKFLHTWSFCIPNLTYMDHGPGIMDQGSWILVYSQE